jgi:D-alanyl-D-alanine carboxypeptidase/D-alanyl-D-alanine-endopeptidase (penicillin-binding protein 4)
MFMGTFSVVRASDSKLEKILSEIKDYKTNFSGFIGVTPDEIIFKSQENKAFIPASVTKVITATVILSELGPATRLKTVLKGNTAGLDGDKLKGDLCLVGAGDPSFVSENMWVLVNNFTRTGIKQILGDLVIDDTLFDQVAFDESRLKNRVDRAYDAPVGAMSFNWNSINVYVRPTKLGSTATVLLDPATEYAKLDSSVITSSKATEISVAQTTVGGIQKIKVKGNIHHKSEEKVYYIPISNPALWSGYNLKAFLSQRGIELLGSIKQGVCGNKANELAISESKPIEQMIKDMNKFSNNFVAEMLIKLLASRNEKPASLQEGVRFIQNYLKKHGYNESEIKITNPSGLTRDNWVTARALWRLLYEAYGNLAINAELVSSLPIAGLDGTLKNRLKDEAIQRRVRAKTGYINGVVSLCGYYSNSQNKIVPFVFLYNGKDSESKVREVMDNAILYLVRH